MKGLSGLFPSGFFHHCHGLARRSHFCKEVAGTWAVSHGQAWEMLLLLLRWLQRRAVKLRLSLRCEFKPLPLLLTPFIFSKATKTSLQCCGHDRHLLALGLPREFSSSTRPSALHHFGENYRAPSCIVTMLCKASEYATL